MDLGALIDGLDLRLLAADPEAARRIRVCDLTEDSRTVVPGSLFVARPGLKADGRAYVSAAVQAGAVAILTDDAQLSVPQGGHVPLIVSRDVPAAAGLLAERFFRHPSKELALFGVTGTNGKTTTTYLIWKMLNALGRRSGLVGTVIVDDGREVGRAMMTTPPAIELSQSLASMVEAGCVAAAMEVSSHSLDQKRADALRFRAAVFTNLTHDHLDYHGTMENYAAAKARLFALVPADGVAIVNADDPWTGRMLQECKAPVMRCRMGALHDAEASVEIRGVDMRGMGLTLHGPWGVLSTTAPLIGRYNAMNVLQAVCCLHAFGLAPEELAAGLAHLGAPPGRLEPVANPEDDVAVFVDYAHTDDALRNVLTAVAGAIPGRAHRSHALHDAAGAPRGSEAEASRLWVVFGCGGDRDRAKRPKMGRAAAELADRVIVTSDNPRSERPGAIVDEILAGIPDGLRAKVVVHVDRARAIAEAILAASPGDVIVIAGKGHETEQLFVDEAGRPQSIHFDDREHARAALARRRGISTAAVAPVAPARRTGSGPSGVQGKWGRTEAPRS